MKTFKFMLAFLLSIFFAFGNVQANEKFYVGGGVGATSISGHANVLYDNVDYGEFLAISGTDIAGKIFAGYRFYNYAALEIGLHRFGNSTDTPPQFFSLDIPVEEWQSKYNAIGASFSILGIVPIVDGFELFGKVGVLLSQVDATNPDFIKEDNPMIDDFKDYGFSVLVGAGFNAKLTDSFSLRGEFEWAQDIASSHFDGTKSQLREYNKAISEEFNDPEDFEAEDYDLDMHVLSTTVSVVWHF